MFLSLCSSNFFQEALKSLQDPQNLYAESVEMNFYMFIVYI